MSANHQYFVYMLASKIGGTIYVGVTNDLGRRSTEHREGLGAKFTLKHKVHMLVWYEQHEDIKEAIKREKRLKKWSRTWKISLIEETNPNWVDLYPSIVSPVDTGSPGQAG